MNIAAFAYKINGVMDTPTSVLMERLRSEGMNVGYWNGFYVDGPTFRPELILTLHENPFDIEEANNIFMQFPDSKFYFHLEWLMPWKCDLEYYRNDWGYENQIDDEYIQRFKGFSLLWDKAHVRSCASKYFVSVLQKFFNSEKPILVKQPGADEKLASAVYKYIPFEERQIDFVTVSRIMPHKKVNIIANAMSKVKIPVTWGIVGDQTSECAKEISSIVQKNKNVKLMFFGWLNGAEKFMAFNNSKFSINCWNGLQPSESILMGAYPLVWNDLMMKEYHSDIADFFDDEYHLTSIIESIVNKRKYYDKAMNHRQNIYNGKLKNKTVTQEAKFILEAVKNAR